MFPTVLYDCSLFWRFVRFWNEDTCSGDALCGGLAFLFYRTAPDFVVVCLYERSVLLVKMLLRLVVLSNLVVFFLFIMAQHLSYTTAGSDLDGTTEYGVPTECRVRTVQAVLMVCFLDAVRCIVTNSRSVMLCGTRCCWHSSWTFSLGMESSHTYTVLHRLY